MVFETVHCHPCAATPLVVRRKWPCWSVATYPDEGRVSADETQPSGLYFQMASKHIVWTPCGWMHSDATVNGHGCAATPHIVVSESVIFAKSRVENPALSDGLGGIHRLRRAQRAQNTFQ